MSENTKKRKIRFNVLDVFVILLIAVLIFSVIYKIYANNAKEANKTETVYIVRFECADAYNSLIRYLDEGDEVYIKSTGEFLGYIYKSEDAIGTDAIVETGSNKPEAEQTEDDTEKKEDEGYRRTSYEGRLKLNGNTEMSRDGLYYILNGQNITVGSKIQVYTDDTEFTITIKQLTDKDAE